MDAVIPWNQSTHQSTPPIPSCDLRRPIRLRGLNEPPGLPIGLSKLLLLSGTDRGHYGRLKLLIYSHNAFSSCNSQVPKDRATACIQCQAHAVTGSLKLLSEGRPVIKIVADVYLRRTQVEAERTSPKSGLEQGEQLSHSRRLDTHFRQRLPFTQFAINRARPPPRRSLGGPITAHPAIQPCQLPSRHWVNLNWYK